MKIFQANTTMKSNIVSNIGFYFISLWYYNCIILWTYIKYVFILAPPSEVLKKHQEYNIQNKVDDTSIILEYVSFNTMHILFVLVSDVLTSKHYKLLLRAEIS